MGLHTAEPPIEALKEWLEDHLRINGNYGHLLLEQKKASDQALVEELRPYFESALLDARQHFHAYVGLDLHPDAGAPGANAQYPACLPVIAKRGIFGELLAGLLTESYQLVGDHDWVVPIFLFRYHEAARDYMFKLARDPLQVREVPGRFGDDFIGISLSEDGSIVRFISGESKWRGRLNRSVVDSLLLGGLVDDKENPGEKVRSGKGIWSQLNKDSLVPSGSRQLQLLLQEYDPDVFSAAILSIDRALSLRDTAPIPRTDLVLFVGNSQPARVAGASNVNRDAMPPEYLAGNDLQVVEVFLSEGEVLIDKLLDSLWQEVQVDGSE